MGVKNRVVRHSSRGIYDIGTLNSILDEGLVCHVAFEDDGAVYNIPMIYVRSGESLFLHCSTGSRIFKRLSSGCQVAVSVTLEDGIVLAKSAYNSSMNYRSATLYGKMSSVTEESRKRDIALALTEKMAKGRWVDCRQPSPQELSVTGMLELPIVEFSSKVRSGPPQDEENDRGLNYWSGVIPLSLSKGKAIGSPDNKNGTETPEYLK